MADVVSTAVSYAACVPAQYIQNYSSWCANIVSVVGVQKRSGFVGFFVSLYCSHLHDTKRLLGAVVSVQTFEETLQGVPRKCIAALRSEGIISPQISPIKRADILLSRKHSAPFGTGKVIHQSFQELNPR